MLTAAFVSFTLMLGGCGTTSAHKKATDITAAHALLSSRPNTPVQVDVYRIMLKKDSQGVLEWDTGKNPADLSANIQYPAGKNDPLQVRILSQGASKAQLEQFLSRYGVLNFEDGTVIDPSVKGWSSIPLSEAVQKREMVSFVRNLRPGLEDGSYRFDFMDNSISLLPLVNGDSILNFIARGKYSYPLALKDAQGNINYLPAADWVRYEQKVKLEQGQKVIVYGVSKRNSVSGLPQEMYAMVLTPITNRQ